MKKTILRGIRIGCGLLMLNAVLVSYCFSGDITIICNQSVAETMVTQSDLKKIFTGKQVRWNDSSKITLALLDNDDVNRVFLNKYLGMTHGKYTRHIKKKVHTSAFREPKTLKTEQEMIDYVASTKGAVGYVTTSPDSWGTWLIKPLAVK